MLSGWGLVILVCVGIVAAFDAPAVDQLRSGNIVISHANPVKGDGVLIAIEGKPLSAAMKNKMNIGAEMKETDVANVVAHAIGAIPVSADIPKQAAVYSKSSSMLKKPQANLMLSISGLGHFTVQELAMSQLQELTTVNPSFTLAATFEPRQSLAQLATLATGHLPSTHGVVGSQWKHGESNVAAYDSSTGSHALVPTIADLVAMSFDDPLIVSLSGDNQYALAMATHPNSGKRSLVFSIDEQKHELTGNDETSSIDNAAIHKLFEESAILGNFVATGGIAKFTDNVVEVKPHADANGADVVNFDLSVSADYLFFAELASIQRLADMLKSGSLASKVSDNSPDLFALTLTGLDRMSSVYGSTDAKTKAAARLLDGAVDKIVSLINTVYHDEVTTQVVLMGSPATMVADVQELVKSIVHKSMDKSVSYASTFPQVYVEEDMDHSDFAALCSQVHNAVSSHGMRAKCMAKYTQRSLLQTKSMLKSSTNSTSDDVISYQINLWVGVTLVLLTFGGIYPLMYLDATSGTFSSFLYAKKYV